MSDLQEHETARQHADMRIHELEDENASLTAELAHMRVQAQVAPNAKVRKGQRRRRKKNLAKKTQTLNAEDVEQLNQVAIDQYQCAV